LKIAVELRQSEKLLKEVQKVIDDAKLAAIALEQGDQTDKKAAAGEYNDAEKKRKEEVVAAVNKDYNDAVAFLKDGDKK